MIGRPGAAKATGAHNRQNGEITTKERNMFNNTSRTDPDDARDIAVADDIIETAAARNLAEWAREYARLKLQLAKRQERLDELKRQMLMRCPYGQTWAGNYKVTRSRVPATIIPQHIRQAHDMLNVSQS